MDLPRYGGEERRRRPETERGWRSPRQRAGAVERRGKRREVEERATTSMPEGVRIGAPPVRASGVCGFG